MSDRDNHAVYFCGKRKKEGVSFEGRNYDVPPCTIAKFLIEAPNDFWDGVKAVATQAIALTADTSMSSATAVIAIFAELRKVYELAAPELLTDLVLVLPALSGFQVVHREVRKVMMSSSERKEVEWKVFGEGFSEAEREKNREEAKVRLSDTAPFDAVQDRWERLINYLAHKRPDSYIEWLNTARGDEDLFVGILREYCVALSMLPAEARKLKREICRAVGIFPAGLDFTAKHQALEELICVVDPPFRISKDKQAEEFPGYEMRENERVFGTASLSTLISLEMQMLEKYYYEFKRCAFCGGYFATSDARAKYCNYECPECEGKTCRAAAPKIVLDRRETFGKLRSEARDTYKHWVERTTERDETKKYLYIKEIERLMRQENKGGDIAKLQKELFDDVRSEFEKWDKNTKEMLKKYENGEISEEECRGAFEIPEERERSKKLSEWKSRITGE